jgi:multidrug efflux system membrane fusion protein
VASPIQRELPVVRELSGKIEAILAVDLKPRVSGVVEKVLVRDGVEVKAGDIILEIDDKPFVAAVAKAQADLERAQSRLHQAELQLTRGKQLVQEKAVSQQAYDDEQTAVETARADLAAARANLDVAQLDLGYTKVVSPIDGRIGKVVTTVGNLVQGGGPVPATLIATILSVNPVYAVFDVDETTWHQVGAHLRASATAGPNVPVDVGLNGETGYPHKGTVVFADNQIDTASGSIRIRASLDNADRSLTPGAYARVQLQIEAPKHTLLINERAVMAKLTTRFVYVVGENGITQFRPVQLGDAVGPLRIINGGLGPTDTIVVNNLAKIFYPGAPVAPVPASMETLQNLADDQGAHPVAADPKKPASDKPATGATK